MIGIRTVQRTNRRFILLSSLQVGTPTNLRPGETYDGCSACFRAASMSKERAYQKPNGRDFQRRGTLRARINKYFTPGTRGCHQAVAVSPYRANVLYGQRSTKLEGRIRRASAVRENSLFQNLVPKGRLTTTQDVSPACTLDRASRRSSKPTRFPQRPKRLHGLRALPAHQAVYSLIWTVLTFRRPCGTRSRKVS